MSNYQLHMLTFSHMLTFQTHFRICSQINNIYQTHFRICSHCLIQLDADYDTHYNFVKRTFAYAHILTFNLVRIMMHTLICILYKRLLHLCSYMMHMHVIWESCDSDSHQMIKYCDTDTAPFREVQHIFDIMWRCGVVHGDVYSWYSQSRHTYHIWSLLKST